MNSVILLAPLKSNGGITSWTKKFIKTFPNEEFRLIPISEVAEDKNSIKGIFKIIAGINDLLYIYPRLKKCVKENDIKLLHTTTSGALGTVRDFLVARFCKKHNIKCIMHCRYGCITEDINRGDNRSKFLLKTMSLFDQIWVLDKRSCETLKNIEILHEKVFLTPNSIEVPIEVNLQKKDFKNFAFIANVLPSKGILELIKAFHLVHGDSILHIIGPSSEEMEIAIKKEARELWGKKIKYHGRLENDQAVKFLETVDSLVLPTYYQSEAFPISILEAMSRGKLVISTPRAAIPDMLTAEDGSLCGILVEEKSVEQIATAINWCINNSSEANILCDKAYNKALQCYDTKVIYELYRINYRKALSQ